VHSSRCSLDHRFSGTLGGGVGWLLVTDLSGTLSVSSSSVNQSNKKDSSCLPPFRGNVYRYHLHVQSGPDRMILLTCSTVLVLIRSVVYKQPTNCTAVFMVYFNLYCNHTFLTNMFRPLLLLSSGLCYYYKNTKVQMYLVVSPSLHNNLKLL